MAPLMMTAFMGLGSFVGLVSCLLVPLSWLIPALRSRSNCYLYAWQRYWAEGASIVLVPSVFGFWLHARSVSPSGHLSEYVPLARKRRRVMPPAVFKGHIVSADL